MMEKYGIENHRVMRETEGGFETYVTFDLTDNSEYAIGVLVEDLNTQAETIASLKARIQELEGAIAGSELEHEETKAYLAQVLEDNNPMSIPPFLESYIEQYVSDNEQSES